MPKAATLPIDKPEAYCIDQLVKRGIISHIPAPTFEWVIQQVVWKRFKYESTHDRHKIKRVTMLGCIVNNLECHGKPGSGEVPVLRLHVQDGPIAFFEPSELDDGWLAHSRTEGLHSSGKLIPVDR